MVSIIVAISRNELDYVFNKMCSFTFDEYKRILKKCNLPVPLI